MKKFIIFIQVFIFHIFISWRFTFHMYKYWVRITLVTLVKLRLNAANNFNMFYVSVIILRGWLLLFPPNTIIILWCKYICVYWGYYIGKFQCITTDRNKIIHKIMSTPCSVSLFFLGDSKKCSTTNTAHRKLFIGLLKENNYVGRH